MPCSVPTAIPPRKSLGPNLRLNHSTPLGGTDRRDRFGDIYTGPRTRERGALFAPARKYEFDLARALVRGRFAPRRRHSRNHPISRRMPTKVPAQTLTGCRHQAVGEASKEISAKLAQVASTSVPRVAGHPRRLLPKANR